MLTIFQLACRIEISAPMRLTRFIKRILSLAGRGDRRLLKGTQAVCHTLLERRQLLGRAVELLGQCFTGFLASFHDRLAKAFHPLWGAFIHRRHCGGRTIDQLLLFFLKLSHRFFDFLAGIGHVFRAAAAPIGENSSRNEPI